MGGTKTDLKRQNTLLIDYQTQLQGLLMKREAEFKEAGLQAPIQFGKDVDELPERLQAIEKRCSQLLEDIKHLNDSSSSLIDMRNRQTDHVQNQVTGILNSVQEAELARMEIIKEALLTFETISSQTYSQVPAECQKFKEQLLEMDSEADLQSFIKTNSPLQDPQILGNIYSYDEELGNSRRKKRFSQVGLRKEEEKGVKQEEEEYEDEEEKSPKNPFKKPQFEKKLKDAIESKMELLRETRDGVVTFFHKTYLPLLPPMPDEQQLCSAQASIDAPIKLLTYTILMMREEGLTFGSQKQLPSEVLSYITEMHDIFGIDSETEKLLSRFVANFNKRREYDGQILLQQLLLYILKQFKNFILRNDDMLYSPQLQDLLTGIMRFGWSLVLWKYFQNANMSQASFEIKVQKLIEWDKIVLTADQCNLKVVEYLIDRLQSYKSKAQAFAEKQQEEMMKSISTQETPNTHNLAYPPLVPIMILVTSISHSLFKLNATSDSLYPRNLDMYIDFLSPLLADTLQLTLKEVILIWLRDVTLRYMDFSEFVILDQEKNKTQNMAMMCIYKLLEKLKRASINRKIPRLQQENIFQVDVEEKSKVTIRYRNKDITYRILRNSAILNKVEKKALRALKEYPQKFKDCVNKLKVVTLLAAASYSECEYLGDLISELGFQHFQEIFKDKELVVFSPDVLQPQQYKLTSALLLISEAVKTQKEKYSKALSPYLKKKLEIHFTEGIRYRLQQILKEQVQDDCLDHEDTNIEDIMQALEQFDQLCGIELNSEQEGKSCTAYFKPAVEKWIHDKLSLMKDKASTCIKMENWQPLNAKATHSKSVVDFFWLLKSILDHAFNKIGPTLMQNWRITFIAMIHESVGDYAAKILQSVGKLKRFKLVLKVPPVLLKIRKKMLKNKLNPQEVPIIRPFPKQIAEDDLSEDRLAMRLANLIAVKSQVRKINQQLFRNCQEMDECDIEIDQALQKLYEFVADKVVFVDAVELIFQELYQFNNSTSKQWIEIEKLSSMADLVVELGPEVKALRKSLPSEEFKLVFLFIFKRLVQCFVHYILVFLQNPLQKIPKNFDNMIHEDLKSLQQFFAFKGKTQEQSGLSAKVVMSHFAPLLKIVNYLRLGEGELAYLYHNPETQEQLTSQPLNPQFLKDLILRILYKRHNSDADKFFDQFKNMTQI